MADMEKLLDGLHCRATNFPEKDCAHCHYGIQMGRRWGCDFMRMTEDALALLKAQEPIEARLHLCESCAKKYPDCNATADGIEFGSGVGNDNIIGCPWYVNRWKAQETRVMTQNEIARCSFCWVEDEEMLFPALFIGMEKRANGQKCNVFLAHRPDSEDCEFWFNLDGYGNYWRCWTSRPTDEQREAVKWG